MTSPATAHIPLPRTALSLIAELMGWSLAPEIGAEWVRSSSGEELLPMSEIQDAWRIVERMRREGWILSLQDCYPDSRWFAAFSNTKSPQQAGVEYGPSPAAAICAAAAAALASAGAAAGRAKGDPHD